MLIVVDIPLEAEVAQVCSTAPVHQLRSITRLLQAHADNQHVVVAPPSICRIWEGCARFSEEQRGVAKKIRARYSELAELQSILPVYAQVRVGSGMPTRANGIWSIPLDWIAANGLSGAHLVCEDLYDCALTKEAALDYLRISALSRLTLSLENIPGGGGNTHRVLAEKAIVAKRLTLCIVDSDRVEPSVTAIMGDTATKCLAVAGDGLYEVSVTPGRELENHIPARLVNKVRSVWQGKQPSDRYAELAAISQNIPVFVDLKSGLKKKDVEGLNGSSRVFWDAFLPQLEAGSVQCCPNHCNAALAGDCKSTLVAPLNRSLLRDTTEYLQGASHDPRRHREYLPSQNDGVWLATGALVAAYGISVKVSAAM
jgi:hypothetical protein